MSTSQPVSNFFTTGENGIEYTTPDKMATFLDAHPEVREKYLEKQLEMMLGLIAWGDYRTAKEVIVLTLDALAIHDEKQGREVLK